MGERMQQNRVFVTKIPHELKEDDIRGYFEGFGKVCDFYMPKQRDGEVEKHKGMAFLSFEEPVDKELILQNAPHQIMGYDIVVDDAKPLRQGGGSSSASAMDHYGGGYGGGWWGSMYDDWMMKGWGGGKGGGGGQGSYTSSNHHNEDGNRVFVTRISEDLTKEDLEAYFCQFGELTDIFVPLKNPNSEQKDSSHKGIAFVSFKDKDTYEEVLSRDKYEIKPNVFIVVDKAAGKEPRSKGAMKGAGKAHWAAMMKGKYGGKGMGKWGDYYDDWDWWWGPPMPMPRGKGGPMMDRWGPY
ncbi:unnamed protein product [Amoebophrya sp. A120]|nr:unnamed protein product [Amoebophrya sp. A120]|eukprot:GSA120T00025410001.1